MIKYCAGQGHWHHANMAPWKDYTINVKLNTPTNVLLGSDWNNWEDVDIKMYSTTAEFHALVLGDYNKE